jgi:two-component system nitrogen regulation response regulator NtrX
MARILIVDDSAVIRQLLTECLGEQGHQIDIAVDGVEGLDMARTGNYDLCICDIHLPKKNGYQILVELGKDRGDTQFIFTDSLPDELYERIQTSTRFACLRKPFGLEQLRALVDQALEKTRTV